MHLPDVPHAAVAAALMAVESSCVPHAKGHNCAEAAVQLAEAVALIVMLCAPLTVKMVFCAVIRPVPIWEAMFASFVPKTIFPTSACVKLQSFCGQVTVALPFVNVASYTNFTSNFPP